MFSKTFFVQKQPGNGTKVLGANDSSVSTEKMGGLGMGPDNLFQQITRSLFGGGFNLMDQMDQTGSQNTLPAPLDNGFLRRPGVMRAIVIKRKPFEEA